jgi:PKD repeat protein
VASAVLSIVVLLALDGSASALPGCGVARFEPPTASFTWTPDPFEAGYPGEFDASSSEPGSLETETGIPPDCIPESTPEPITSYRWEFGDGAEAESPEATVNHAYLNPGTYDVTLEVEDEAPSHSSGQVTHMVTVIDITPPDTIIDTGPTGTIADSRPLFTFHSTEAESTFQCSIDTGSPAFGPCSGVGQDQPASALAPGSYAFRVRATDKHGNMDPTPAVRSFTVAPPAEETGGPGGTGGTGGSGGSGGSGGGSSGGAGSSKTAPDTVLGAHPKNVVKTGKRASVRFSFSSAPAGATFECRMDRGAFTACTSPKSYRLKPGRHSFSVRAVSGGVEDPTPAGFAFRVVRKPAGALAGPPAQAQASRRSSPPGPRTTWTRSSSWSVPGKSVRRCPPRDSRRSRADLPIAAASG